MVEVKNLSKKFDDIIAVDNISFKINNGEIAGFLGPNGAGKSTTLKMMTTYLKPSSGDIFYNNIKISDHNYDIRKDIGYLPEQNPLYHEMLVFDYLKYMCELKDIPKESIQKNILYAAEKCGITDRLSQSIGTLSKGYKQRTGLAQAILNDPKILILDEPTVGLDPNQILEIRSLIKELGKEKTVILSSHILQEIQALCEKIIIIHKGKIITDTTKERLLIDIKQKNIIHLAINNYLDETAFKDLDDSVKVKSYKMLSSVHYYVFEYSINIDLREAFFDIIVKHNLKILEFYQETQNLEDVFTLLTNKKD